MASKHSLYLSILPTSWRDQFSHLLCYVRVFHVEKLFFANSILERFSKVRLASVLLFRASSLLVTEHCTLLLPFLRSLSLIDLVVAR